MIEEDNKPNPDELLRAIQKQELQKKLGRLKIFFGMSAGVGKTFSMLQEAQQRLKENVHVVIGTINTHGRKETEDLLHGLPLVPEKWVKYKDILFKEMDLESILIIKPQLVLVDELAHTNVPGSKHLKRWQDVIDILDAGIDVYTTLNVQHIESRKDLVESLTGIQVHETVPDLILERASSIKLIDIPPSELLQRLQEGKVYLGDQSRIAAENFFQEEHLMALREISLRFTAEKVDHDLHEFLQGRGWKARERVMVAISPSPSSEQVIRAARRLAFELDAPWVVVYVDTGTVLEDRDQVRLNRHFNLARQLGAEVLITHDIDIASALQRVAKQKDITRIVLGRPPRKKWGLRTFFQDSFIERLEKENKQLDIVILRQDRTVSIYQRFFPKIHLTDKWSSYRLAIVAVAGMTGVGWLVSLLIGYKSVGFIFLLGILTLSFFVSRGPIFLSALLSAMCWYFFFVPSYTPGVTAAPEDIFLAAIYFCAAAIMGTMTSRLREQDQFLRRREETMERLYEIERDIANSTNLQYLRLNVCSRLENQFAGKFDILVKGQDNQLILDTLRAPLNLEKEQATAVWVFKNGKVGGWSTDTLPSASGIYFPIKSRGFTLGVLAYFPKRERSLSMVEMDFIQTTAEQLGGYLDKHLAEEAVSKLDYSRQIERMHESIFHSLNRSFYDPLEGIFEINRKIQKECADHNIRDLAAQMEQFISNIKLTVDNVIAISELGSGFVRFESKNNSIKEVIDACLKEMKPFLRAHPFLVEMPPQIVLLPFDARLLRLALNNLILNAVEYSFSTDPITIKVQVVDSEFRLAVLDEGPGIPEEIVPLIFDKFYSVPGTSKGLGLGLAVVKEIVDLHRGTIEVKNREKRGTEFSLILPSAQQME